MRVVPVLDVQGGLVVRGIAGRRNEYRPIVSRLTPSVFPVSVADAFRFHFSLTDLYVADLDAIAGSPPALPMVRDIVARGFRLWVDAGVRDWSDAAPLAEAGVAGIVVGLETLCGPYALHQIVGRLGVDRVVFSLDLNEGKPLGDRAGWQGLDAEKIAAHALDLGVRRVIVLDLSRVGTGSGVGTEELCQRLATAYPDAEIVAGGGVRDANDLRRFRQIGVRAVLVASALHDGRLRREDLDGFAAAYPSNR
jgi:phosphoribosylformimino-5-aminoimidazole carboxamide ribotide isomerase